MAEIRDRVVLFGGLSVNSFNTASVTPIGSSANGWIIAGGYAPKRTFNSDTATITDIKNTLATLISDLYAGC